MASEDASEQAAQSTTVNVVASWATSITVDIGEIPPGDVFGEEFPWQDFDDALVRHLDSLSESELRGLYRESEAISAEDPICNEAPPSEADVSLEADGAE